MTNKNGRSFPEDCLEALWERALPQIGKMRFGSCVGEVANPRSLRTVQNNAVNFN